MPAALVATGCVRGKGYSTHVRILIRHNILPNPPRDNALSVDVASEHPHTPNGTVLHRFVSLNPIKAIAPNILQYLTLDGTQLLFPCSKAIDEDVLLCLLNTMQHQYCAAIMFDLELNDLPQNPIKPIKSDVILTPFGLGSVADSFSTRLWHHLGACDLTLAHVFCI